MKPVKRLLIILLFLIVGLALTLFALHKPYLLPGYHLLVYTSAKYEAEIKQIAKNKAQWKKAPIEVKQIQFIKSLTQQVFPYWYGTRWGFYGTSQTPGKGKIACGYFVTTTLKHMGVPLDRVALAKCASEKMIRSLVQPKYIWHFNDQALDEFCDNLLDKGFGLYIIGLDNHTGYIWVKPKGEIRFIHSSGRFPFCVINEDARESTVLRNSSYKVLGKITADEHFMQQWLQ